MRKLRIALIFAASSGCYIAHRVTDGYGVLQLSILDERNRAVPARVSIRDSAGASLVPDSALPVFADCGKIPLDNWLPSAAALQTKWGEYRGLQNPYQGSTDFYATGTLRAQLRPGRYYLRVEKGPEYTVVRQEFVITSGREQGVRVALRRWINLPAEGWYSSDDHLHIPRPSPEFDPPLAAWMQAEDIHVANLLQMGLARDVHLTPQRAFGASSLYQSGTTLLIGGEENPRTHIFGHSILLGAKNWIDFPQAYLLYDLAWREAHRQGGLAGYAHLGVAGAQDGLALWGQQRLIVFIEVLNLGFPYYRDWYDALNVGERLVPTAGTDYPCLADLPGRERFYTKLDDSLAFSPWIDAVRRGRIFITNGPALEFSINSSLPGDDITLPKPGAVRVRARVRFDPSRDRVDRLEIVQGGRVVAAATQARAGEITLDASVQISVSAWLAARASGEKVGERPAGSVEAFARYVERLKRRADANLRETLANATRPRQNRISAAHAAPIYVTVAGTPRISSQPAAREVARSRLDLLDDLAVRIENSRLPDLARFPGSGDGVTLEDLRGNHAALVRAIEAAKDRYRTILQAK